MHLAERISVSGYPLCVLGSCLVSAACQYMKNIGMGGERGVKQSGSVYGNDQAHKIIRKV